MIASKSFLPAPDLEVLADRLFPAAELLPSLTALEAKYPPRTLPTGAKVTRFAPSPTGFAHIGAIFTSLINRTIAHQSGDSLVKLSLTVDAQTAKQGLFLLRIEDTDSKRLVEGACETIVRAMTDFGLTPDEGIVADTECSSEHLSLVELGSYGPYVQSQRADIYRACTRYLVENGLAYPCFCSESEIAEMQERQRIARMRPGYYGKWATWRDAPLARIQEKLASGEPYVVRFRAWGSPDKRISWIDGVHGAVSLPENDLDVVILKSDGTSLYHLAHALDDHYMRITDVIRGDEWLSSVPLHMQIFAAFGWTEPAYSHLAPIQKLERIPAVEDGEPAKESRRKLSKRKDPEANVDFYYESGFPPEAVIEYLLNIANSDFEEWRRAQPTLPRGSFIVKMEKLSKSGALVDVVKLQTVSRLVIGSMSIDAVYAGGLEWATRFDPELSQLMIAQPNYTKACLAIEREVDKASKRIGSWKDLRIQTEWFYDQWFSQLDSYPFPANLLPVDMVQILDSYAEKCTSIQEKDAWFSKCKELALELGFAANMKDFKKTPEQFKGHIGDVTMVIRVALSGRQQTPDLFEMSQVMGISRVTGRLKRAIEKLS